MDIPFLIGDQNGASSSHGPLTSSPPLFSPSTFNMSNLDDDDGVMFFRQSITPPKEDLLNVHPFEEGQHTIKFKPGIEKRNYDTTKKFKIHGLLSFLGQNYV